MSASEQEVKSQIAEMREALRSAAASRRAARVVNIVAVLVGFVIVAVIVYNIIWGLGGGLVNRPADLQKAFMDQVTPLELDRKAMQALQEAAPAYVAQGRKMVEDLKLDKVALKELQALMADLEPTLLAELGRVRPRLMGMLDNQGQALLDDLERLLQKKLNSRLAGILGQQGGRLSEESGLDEAAIERIITDLQDASTSAFQAMLDKRKGTLLQEKDQFLRLLAQIEPMPETTQEKVLEELGLVLLTLLKYEIPEYKVSLEKITAKAPPAAPAAVEPAAAPSAAPARMPAEAREKMEEARERGRKAAEEARPGGEQAGAPGVAAPPHEMPAEARKRMEEARERGREAAEEAPVEPGEKAGEVRFVMPPAGMPPEARERREEIIKRAEEAKAKEGAE